MFWAISQKPLVCWNSKLIVLVSQTICFTMIISLYKTKVLISLIQHSQHALLFGVQLPPKNFTSIDKKCIRTFRYKIYLIGNSCFVMNIVSEELSYSPLINLSNTLWKVLQTPISFVTKIETPKGNFNEQEFKKHASSRAVKICRRTLVVSDYWWTSQNNAVTILQSMFARVQILLFKL